VILDLERLAAGELDLQISMQAPEFDEKEGPEEKVV